MVLVERLPSTVPAVRRLCAAALLPLILTACTVQLPGSQPAATVTETVTPPAPSPSSSTPTPLPPRDAQGAAVAAQVRQSTTVYDAVSDEQIVEEGMAWCESIQNGLDAGSSPDVAVTQAFNAGGAYAAEVYGLNGAREFGVLAGAATVTYCPQHIAAINAVLAANGAQLIPTS